MSKRVPLVIILGATGTGKSKLALELASKFKGEIISADSMQVYKGLDIITNKVTDDEITTVPHHMISFVDPLEKYTVKDYRDKALPIIEKLMNDGKIPFVVGGTHYYIESLVWEILLGNENGGELVKALIHVQDLKGSLEYLEDLEQRCDIHGTTCQKLEESKEYSELLNNLKNYGQAFEGKKPRDVIRYLESLQITLEKQSTQSFLNLSEIEAALSKLSRFCNRKIQSTLILMENVSIINFHKENNKFKDQSTTNYHQMLKKIDPVMADQLHPHNRRKIIRSIEVYYNTGERHSDLLKDQRQIGGSYLGGPLRFKDVVMLWIQCQEDVLDRRLDDRVDEMIFKGLANELKQFHDNYNKKRLEEMSTHECYEEGIFQSIGFKEFHEYLTKDHSDEKKDQELKNSIDNLKIATRRYARQQKKWITNRFIRETGREIPRIYGLDATNPSQWNEKVYKPAECVLKKVLEPDKECDVPQPLARLSGRTETEQQLNYNTATNFCDVCQRTFVGKLQWDAHINSKKHQKVLKNTQNKKKCKLK